MVKNKCCNHLAKEIDQNLLQLNFAFPAPREQIHDEFADGRAFSLGDQQNCGSTFSEMFHQRRVSRWTWSEPARGEEGCGGIPAKVLRFDQLYYNTMVYRFHFTFDYTEKAHMRACLRNSKQML